MSIHVERTGGPPDLPAAFARFVVRHLGGRSLDDQKDEEAKLGKFPDFACYRDLVLIEMKHLEVEQNERINATYKSRVRADEEPMFYGTRRLDVSTFSNGDEIASAILSKLAQTIETQLRKANHQFEKYRERNPRKNSLSICLLLNSKIDEFSPDVVMRAVQGKMKPTSAGVRFPHIDAVLYISEKHVQQLPDGRVAFALVQVIGLPAEEQSWKMEVIERVMQRWSEFRTGGAAAAGRSNQFESIFDVPPKMAHCEAWKLAYRRNPYLRGLTNQQLKIYFHRCVGFCALLMDGNWPKPSQGQHLGYVRQFGDAIEEINHRQIDLRRFAHCDLSAQERAEAYSGLPQELIDVLSGRIQ
ncbi:hypothetical protein [Bradyrhizobium sp.]|uniref:hypothetical protein n=1 Tax=Bradyrhizobium sp. TaxID=376 RepID=UPI002BA5E5C9|nr:hypothetical protein [Bradyrhizobium sp.]HMM92352.1 hypothetical protein [Bradyrhizobium sp.]